MENAEREASTTRLDFRPSSNSGGSFVLPSSFSPVSSPSLAAMHTPPRRPPGVAAAAPSPFLGASEASAATSPTLSRSREETRLPRLSDSVARAGQSVLHKADDEDQEAEVRRETIIRHEETEEERSVTYSIGPVHRRVPASMNEWWAVHQSAMGEQAQRKLSSSDKQGDPFYGVAHTGALVHVLADAISFTADFSATFAGSAACLDEVVTTDAEADFAEAYSAACASRLLLRIRSSVDAALPGTLPTQVSAHLAAVAWHVVQHTTVALGASVEEHYAVFAVPSAALPAQCVVYPGLMCSQRLPSKREMTGCDHPRVLLLAGDLTYPVQPAEDLVDYVRSYSGYLDKLFQRLAVWNPDVIVVEGGMHHYLKERIEEQGHMRLLLHVGRDFLVRLSWCLHADIIADLQYVSVADLATTTPMGECQRFEVVELAEEERFCGFSGFLCVSFHTLIFRGRNVWSAPLNAGKGLDRAAALAPWNALVQLARDAVTAAYHAAMQAHWVLSLIRAAAATAAAAVPSAAFAATIADKAAAHVASTAASAAGLTLNSGCKFGSDVLTACLNAGASARLLRDTLVVNVVLLDHLHESGSNSAGAANNPSTGAAGGGGASRPPLGIVSSLSGNALTNTRGSDVRVDVSLPGSHASSAGTSRNDLASLGSLGFTRGDTGVSAGATAAAATTGGAHGYAVVQRKMALTFYGSGDDTLYIFLLSRCTAAASQLLYLHGGHRVKVTVTRAAPKISVVVVPSSSSGGSGGAAASATVFGQPRMQYSAALEASQRVAFHLAGMRQNATRTFAPGEAAEEAVAINAGLRFLTGYFSLRVTSESVSRDSTTTSAAAGAKAQPMVDVTVPLCSPHLLNLSTAAFLEWVLYGWMPLLSPPTGQEAQQRLRLVFTFHSDLTVASTSAAGAAAAASSSTMYKDTVTLLVDPVPVLRIQYPPSTLPARPTPPTAAANSVAMSDWWYAAHDADELEATLRGFYVTLKSVLDTMAPSPAESGAADDGNPVSSSPSSPPQQRGFVSKSTTLFFQLCDSAKLAAEALRESRMHGPLDMALFLRPLRQHLIPTLMSDLRTWQAEARRTTSRDAPDAAAVSAVTDRGILRSLEDCYYHPERVQWVRLGEPASVLAAALDLIYGGASAASPTTPFSPVVSSDARSFPERSSLTTAAVAGVVTSTASSASSSAPHQVRFAVAAEISPVPSSDRSSFAPPLNAATSAAGLDDALLCTPSLTCAEALDILRHWGRSEPGRPSSLTCRLRGYAPVLPLTRGGGSVGGGTGGSSNSLGSGAVSTVNALVETGASAIMGLGGGGGGGSSTASPAGGVGSAGGGSSSAHNSVAGGGAHASGGAGELSLSVEVLFPQAFAALHVLYTNGAPLDFPAALLRCHPYTTDGGKSQSRFFVTEDGRFLVKCVKPMELRYFKEWAPRYFARMADCYAAAATSATNPATPPPPSPFDAQTTLGKVLGLYVVHVNGSRVRPATSAGAATGAAAGSSSSDGGGSGSHAAAAQQATLRHLLPDGTHCFMVAEQLLFQRPVRETWDLKGSQRNRTTEQTAAVRLDVDLVQERLRHGDFLFCAPEEKILLMDHLSRDTQLLSESGTMDYSLMASVGTDGSNLYVGMIDYLHPYSSAKVLESKMKSGLDTVFGYGRRDPTIIDPPSYAARFMLWMDGYLNGVPDRLFPLTRVCLLAKRGKSGAAPRALEDEEESP